MKSSVLIVLCLFSTNLHAQEPAFDAHTWEAPYSLPTPKDWGIERFLIPISFAPEIGGKGVEDIRFSPGWAKVKSEEYWSYAFLWYLEGGGSHAEMDKLDSKGIEINLKAYYTGLVRANGSKIPADKVIPVVTTFKESNQDKGDLKTYVGTISMTDYMSQRAIVLNCRVHLKNCAGSNRTFVFYELSPQSFSHNIWQSLDQLWLDFKCEKD